MRTLMILLILATSAVAGPGSWQAIRYGNDETQDGTSGPVSGNAGIMEVIAHTVATHVNVFAMSDPLCASEDGSGSDMDTVWYELTFVGDGSATNHKWSIETDINGTGTASAESVLQGTAIGQSLQTIHVTGNHVNSGAGQLGVADTAGIKFSLKPPDGLDIALEDSTLAVGSDTYKVVNPKKTVGAGTKCRIRIDTSAEAKAKAKTYIGHVSVSLYGILRVNVEMKGSCTIGGMPVEDRFKIGCAGITRSSTSAPSGGIVPKRETPTDTPEEELPDDEPDDEEPDGDEPDDEGPEPQSTGDVDSTAILE